MLEYGPDALAGHRGHSINISSRAGLGIRLTGLQACAASKAAQMGLTRPLAHALHALSYRDKHSPPASANICGTNPFGSHQIEP